MAERRRLSKAGRQKVYDKCGGHCAYCGQEIRLEEMQVDHVEPIRKGGADSLENMFPACRSCNHYKSTLSIEQFRERIQKIPGTLFRDSVTFRNGARFGVVKAVCEPVVFYFETRESPRRRPPYDQL